MFCFLQYLHFLIFLFLNFRNALLCIIVPVWSTVNTRSVSDDKLLLIRQNLYVAGHSGQQRLKLIKLIGLEVYQKILN